MSEATYLYCLVRAPEKPSLAGAPPGLPGLSPPRALDAGDGLWLIAADAPLPEYGGDEIQRRLSDLSWVSDRALAHEAVIEHFAAAGAVVPMKLFTLFSADERAVAFIQEDRERLGRVLDRVEARVEWGVRVRLDDVRARDVLAAEAQAGAGGKSSGTAFLLRKKLEQDASRELAGRLRSEMDATFAELAEGASEAVRREPAASLESGGRLLLDAAFLVPRERSADFEAIVERCARRLAPRACDVTLTGPWPPYNFIAEVPAKA
ncbi:MAG TPA: GvpL/GvpF family gas vesicle protein [Thermoanaerobaculia bacterium]